MDFIDRSFGRYCSEPGLPEIDTLQVFDYITCVAASILFVREPSSTDASGLARNLPLLFEIRNGAEAFSLSRRLRRLPCYMHFKVLSKMLK